MTATYRATNTEVDIAGQRIPKDQTILVWYGAANRDGRQFADPDVFDRLGIPTRISVWARYPLLPQGTTGPAKAGSP